MKTLRQSANDETIEKINEITDPRKILVLNYLLEKDFGTLTYMDSTLLRDVLNLNLNQLVLYFNKL